MYEFSANHYWRQKLMSRQTLNVLLLQIIYPLLLKGWEVKYLFIFFKPFGNLVVKYNITKKTT